MPLKKKSKRSSKNQLDTPRKERKSTKNTKFTSEITEASVLLPVAVVPKQKKLNKVEESFTQNKRSNDAEKKKKRTQKETQKAERKNSLKSAKEPEILKESEETKTVPSTRSAITPTDKEESASNRWANKIVEMNLRQIRKEFMEKVKRYVPPGTRTAFMDEANSYKNRYEDVEMLDKHRVILKASPDGDDYIHANFVKISPEMTLICTQGPLDETVQNFWIMILENKCKVIVQLCQNIENKHVKCNEYFPPIEEGDEKMYGIIKVRVLQRNMDVGGISMVERTLLEASFKKMRIQTTHILFSGWPDHSVPADPKSYIEMRKIINGLYEKKPIVVHCSAGIGRSGSYAAIEVACYQLMRMHNMNFEIDAAVRKIRDQRTQSVQIDLQYLFVIRIILEILLNEGKVNMSSKMKTFFNAYDNLLNRKKRRKKPKNVKQSNQED